jgi:hypothetical protein
MTEDDKERGLYFYSSLKSFRSRTAYANTGLDHLVGWGNSSLRFYHELPRLPTDSDSRGKGVVLQDDIMAAFQKADIQHMDTSRSNSLQSFSSGGESVEGMLIRLQQLPWRRIDVDFAGSNFSILSHNHIQARWNWINRNGRSVAVHLAEQLVQLEEISRMHDAAEESRPQSEWDSKDFPLPSSTMMTNDSLVSTLESCQTGEASENNQRTAMLKDRNKTH